MVLCYLLRYHTLQAYAFFLIEYFFWFVFKVFESFIRFPVLFPLNGFRYCFWYCYFVEQSADYYRRNNRSETTPISTIPTWHLVLFYYSHRLYVDYIHLHDRFFYWLGQMMVALILYPAYHEYPSVLSMNTVCPRVTNLIHQVAPCHRHHHLHPSPYDALMVLLYDDRECYFWNNLGHNLSRPIILRYSSHSALNLFLVHAVSRAHDLDISPFPIDHIVLYNLSHEHGDCYDDKMHLQINSKIIRKLCKFYGKILEIFKNQAHASHKNKTLEK